MKKMKKLLAFALVLVMLIGMMPTTASARPGGGNGGNDADVDYTVVSTVTFRIVNGTWSESLALAYSDDVSINAERTEVTFRVYYCEGVGYVYECEGPMEAMLLAILGHDGSFGSAYIVPDAGYVLDGEHVEWNVVSGGIDGSTASANDQMEEISDNIHDYDDNKTPEGGFLPNTVYELVLTKDGYTVTGTIDNGGTVTNEYQEIAKYNDPSLAMVFTPATGYSITGVTVNGTPVSFTVDSNGVYTYPAQNVIYDIAVVVTTTLNTYTVTWVNYDDTQLEKDENVPYGSTPEYNGDTPVKPDDAQYKYVFAGWTPEISPVTGDITYKAVFKEASTRTYTVTWVNHNKDILEEDTNVAYGTAVNYDGKAGEGSVTYGGATPTKASDSHYTYEFSGWELYEGTYTNHKTGIVGNTTFIAVFTAKPIPRAATVEVILNGTVDPTNETVTGGEHKNISDMVSGADDDIYLRLVDGTGDYIKLVNEDEEGNITIGVYTNSDVANGDYGIYVKIGESYVRVGTQILTISNADRTKYLPYYSVTYAPGDAGENATNMPGTEYYYIGSHVDVSSLTPEWVNNIFKGWKEGDTPYQPSTALETVHLDTSITQAHTLTAQWEAAATVNVTVVVDHDDRNLNDVAGDLTVVLTSSTDGTNYNEVDGAARTFAASKWTVNTTGTTSTYGTVTYTGYPTIGLSYSADAAIDGYKHVKTEVEQKGNTYDVTVYLVYDPAGFELKFDVLVDASIPVSIQPDEVDVKVTYWDGDSWEPISDHVNHSVAVAIDLTENGLTEDGKYYKGTGTVHVPAFKNNQTNVPYLYRIELVRMDFGSYQLAMSDTDNVNYSSSQFYFFPAGCFTGTVEVGEDCANGLSVTGGLYGSHAYQADADEEYEQHDSITAYITAETYTIALDLNYDNGEASDIFAQIPERLTVPALDAYGIPTRDGFTFAGWYTLDGTYTGDWGTQISGGEYIHKYVEDIPDTLNLYAKWNKNFDVAGTVYLDMGYPCNDASRTVTVALQWRAANGTVYVTQRSQTITLDPGADGDNIDSGTYLFEDVANIGEYRVYVLAPNGGTITYQNEPESVNDSTDYTKYTASDYVVVDEDADGTAYVNIFMDAMDFDLGYMVDASAIGEGFRPTDVIMDLRHDHRSGNSVSYEVIEDELTTTVAAATGLSAIGKIAVPPYHANGYLYDYVISVLRYKGADGSADEWNRYFHYSTTEGYIERPFSVRYTGPANYSETANNDGLYQDVTLKAIFEPKSYTINYDLAGGSWPSADYRPVRVHTWSFETPITAVPVREGYVFMGWTVADDAKAYTYVDGAIPASVWEDVYLVAVWERDVIDDPDEEDPDPDKPGDGVPDKYQVVIKYVAGQGGAVAPTEEVITMRVDNKLVTTMDITVAGSVATPAEDYVFDGWSHDYDNAELDVTKAATGEFTITNAVGNSTYTFTASFAEDKKGNPEGGEDQSDEIADKYQVFVEFQSADTAQGTVTDENAESPDNDATGIYQTYTFADKATSGDVTPVLTNVLVTPAQNYAFDIWTRDTSNAPVLPTKTLKDVPGGTTVVFWAHFAEDTIVDPDKDPDPDKPGDGIPDKYQAVVTYKVVNGSWSDGTDTDIQAVFTLYNYDADHGYWVAVIPVPTLDDTVPTGMTPDDGYSASSGAWNDGLTEEELKETHPSNGAVYTYTFDEKEIIIVVPTGSVSLIKVDSADDTILLADVVFKLYSASGAYIGTYTTDANGTILVTGLPVGDYYWEETRPAQGYELGGEKIHFTVVANKTVTVTVKNTRSDIPGVFTDDHYAYIIGYPDGMVHPEGNITRAEVATIFFRLLSDATRAQYMTKTNSFADVNEGDWFNTAVSTMAAMGIVNGYPDGNFYPNDYITRAEFAAIAARFDTNGNTSDADFSDVYGHWAEDEIFISANNGWILGYPDGSFDPDKNISRAEAMAVVNRVLQRIPRSADDLLDDMVVWPDNMNVNAWYYLAVQEATNSHEYSRYPDMTEHWTALREVPDWTIYEK